jgi:hypothetical protein
MHILSIDGDDLLYYETFRVIQFLWAPHGPIATGRVLNPHSDDPDEVQASQLKQKDLADRMVVMRGFIEANCT